MHILSQLGVTSTVRAENLRNGLVPKLCSNFDTPSRVVCYRVVIISELTSPDFNEPKDWEVHSVVGFPEMPPDDFMRQTRHDYLRALG